MSSKARKPKQDSRSVMYVRVTPEDRAHITQIVQKRGYPHTMASVASEMLSRGLASEPKTAPRPAKAA